MPWDNATIKLRNNAGVIVATQKITEGHYIFSGFHTSGNPYTLIGRTTVSGKTYGKTVGGIMVISQSRIRENLVMTSPPS